nr:zinc finger, CCHC-type, retrotransposon Gag domain protein [Tanacetum cinerariifolium]
MVDEHHKEVQKDSTSKGAKTLIGDAIRDESKNKSSSDYEGLNYGGFTEKEAKALRSMINKQVGKAIKNVMPFYISQTTDNLKEVIRKELEELKKGGMMNDFRNEMATYRDFTACDVPKFNGTLDLIACTKWLSTVEGAFCTSCCKEKNKEFKEMFTTEYAPVEEVDKIQEEFQTLTQTNERVNEMWKKFNDLIRYCPVYHWNENLKVEKFQRMLRDDIREVISLFKCTTLEYLLSRAQLRESDLLRKKNKETKRKLDFVDRDAKKSKQDQSQRSGGTQLKTHARSVIKLILEYVERIFRVATNVAIEAKPLKSIKEEKVDNTGTPTPMARAYMMATEEGKVVRDAVTDTNVEKKSAKDVPVVNGFLDIFPKDLPDALSQKEREKVTRIYSLRMIVTSDLFDRIKVAQLEALKEENYKNRLITSAHFIPIREGMSVHKLPKIYVNEIVVRHRVPVSIVSDRDGRFTSNFWQDFQKELGMRLHMSTAFDPQTDDQSKRIIQTLEDMLRACVIDFGGNWDDHLPLVEFTYNNSYHVSINMPPYEMLYGMKCRTPRVSEVAYVLELTEEMKGIHNTFYVSYFRKCLADESSVIALDEVEISPELNFQKELVAILGRKSRQLRNKEIPLVKVEWMHQKGTSIKWEPKEKMRIRTLICWNDVGSMELASTDVVSATTKKIEIIRERLKEAQDRWKGYDNKRRRPIEFNVGDFVMLKVSPWKGVRRFKNKRKLSPRFIGPFKILKRVDEVAYVFGITRRNERLKKTQDRWKSYTNKRRRPIEFNVGDFVMLKVSPWKGVMRFKNKGILSPRFIGPFKKLKRVGKIAYVLELPEEMKGIHNTFHVSYLRKCLADESSVIALDEVENSPELNFQEQPVAILGRKSRQLRNKEIPLVKVEWKHRKGTSIRWEPEEKTRITSTQTRKKKEEQEINQLVKLIKKKDAQGKFTSRKPRRNQVLYSGRNLEAQVRLWKLLIYVVDGIEELIEVVSSFGPIDT